MKGNLVLNFLYKKDISNEPGTFDSPSMQTTTTQTHNSKTLSNETNPIGKENFAKIIRYFARKRSLANLV